MSIKGFAFNPSIITVTKGTTITWTNQDAVPHTVTSAGIFDSGTLQLGESWSYKFDTSGSYDYKCNIHPFMMEKVIVE